MAKKKNEGEESKIKEEFAFLKKFPEKTGNFQLGQTPTKNFSNEGLRPLRETRDCEKQKIAPEDGDNGDEKFKKIREAFESLYKHHDKMKEARKRAYEKRFPNNELSPFFKEDK